MMLRRLAAWRTQEGGASAVEFALVIGPLLFLLLGAIECGRLLWTRQILQSLAISTARCMGVRQADCASSGAYSATKTTSYVIAQAVRLRLTITSANVALDAAASCGGVSGFSSATISYTFVTVAPKVVTALAGGAAISGSACFPNQPTT
jgi:Flp pilus assembly protein TadG